MPAGERTRSRRSYSTRFHTTLCVSYTTLAQQNSNNNALRQGVCALTKAQQTWERGAGLPEACNPGQHKAGRTCRCTPDIGNLKALKKQAPRVPRGCSAFPRRKGQLPKAERKEVQIALIRSAPAQHRRARPKGVKDSPIRVPYDSPL